MSSTATARIFATREEVDAARSITGFGTVLRSGAVFEGLVAGELVEAESVYQGRSDLGGQIDARIRLSGGVHGVLHVEAEALEGGSCEGFVIRR